ncbi:hypothetical protein GCM10009665_76910 [Kitasatospora nipponensis]|uniref:Uncharacterized protein n=1 Tax=Kitasatospora nipponensis TaxID=258049 RepID=A0ABN1T8W4_9ACTN
MTITTVAPEVTPSFAAPGPAIGVDDVRQVPPPPVGPAEAVEPAEPGAEASGRRRKTLWLALLLVAGLGTVALIVVLGTGVAANAVGGCGGAP